uniref:Uncharacterized protein n=1 Tax=Globodera rostochiensis TaxID=31243 RepID=A0A914I8D7_GLORO
MSFNLLPTIELKLCDDTLTKSAQEFVKQQQSSKIVDHAQIVYENFWLVLLLTSNEDLIVHYRIGTSSRFTSFPIRSLFSEKVILEHNLSFSQLALTAIAFDCSVVVFISSDGQTILLVPFRAFMDVTWRQKSTLSVVNPTIFSPFDLESEYGLEEKQHKHISRVCTAICFHSLTEHTFLIFSDRSGSLYIVNLNLQRIDVKIDLKAEIFLLHTFLQIGRNYLLVSFSDRTQLMLPLESNDTSVRETLMRVTTSQIHQVDQKSYILPQVGESVCVLNFHKNQLSIFDFFQTLSSAPPQFCLEFFASDNIRQVLCMSRMVVVLTLQNDLFIHLRVFHPTGTSVRYEPTKAIFTSDAPLEEGTKILHLIPSASANANRSVRTQKSLNDFILDHLSSKFYSLDCLSTVADFLQISPPKLCLSLLRCSLRIPSAVDVPQVNSIISLAFKCKIEPSALLSVLQESSREDLLLPFLRVKIEKDSGDKSLRQFLLGALLARIAHISEDETKLEENGHRKELEVEKDALEYELRNFLIKFDVNEPEVLLVLLRYSLLSCVCVLLCRNASVHSPTVVRFLLEWPDWKSIELAGSLLKCLSYMHWPSIDSYSRTVVAKIAKLLIERSIDCAHSLQLMCLLRLFHFTMEKEGQSKCELKLQKNSVDSGPNFVPIPTAWDFDRFSGANGEQCSTLARARKRLPRGKERAGPFVHTSIPQAVKLPDSRLQIRAVSCGTEHVLLLTVVGRLFSWGLNRYGQCGDGTEKPIVSPIEIKGKWGSIVSICAGHYHSGFVSESGEIYLWGWGLYGQLGNGQIADLRRPTKSRPFSALGCVKTICLGYSHTLVLCFDGRVFGCGALSHGQLGVDPRHLEGNPIKATNPIQLPFPMPISLLASKYFHGIALGVDERNKGVLFEWGDSPQSLKMQTFLQRRLRSKQKKEAKGKTEHPSMAESGEPVTSMVNLPQVHLRIRKLCEWDDGSVKALSAGFNHSALLTVDGELFTWGKSLEMQLGHLNRKEKVQPTKVEAPQGVRWVEVVCARNFTTAVSVEGKIFVWGRNDKFQLGLGPTDLKAPGQIRKIALKSYKGTAQRSVELPVDNCVETPSIVPGLRAFTEGPEQTIPNEAQLSEVFSNANQLALNTLSRFLLKHPLLNFMAVQAHLMSGDLLAALRLLVSLVKRDGLLSESTSTLSQSNWTERGSVVLKTSPPAMPCPSNSSSLPSSDSKRLVAVKLRSTFCSSSSSDFVPGPLSSRCLSPSATPTLSSSSAQRLEHFHAFVDKIWALLRIHPLREVQTCALVELLYHRFPVYNRLSTDLCLCRLVEPFLTILSPSDHIGGGLVPSLRVRLTEIGIRERAVRLRQAKVTGGVSFLVVDILRNV